MSDFAATTTADVVVFFLLMWHQWIGYVQEIKFEPNVMCEPIDKKLTFRARQV